MNDKDIENFMLNSHGNAAHLLRDLGRELLAYRAAAPSPEALQRFVAESREAQLVPGDWECRKCKFVLTTQTLYINGGTIGVSESNRTEPELCPNGCGTLERVTWRRAYERLHEASLTHVAKLREFEQAIGTPEIAQEAVDVLKENEFGAYNAMDLPVCTYCSLRPPEHDCGCRYAALLAKLPKGDAK